MKQKDKCLKKGETKMYGMEKKEWEIKAEKEAEERNDRFEKSHPCAALTGTPAQITWARSIRREKFYEIEFSLDNKSVRENLIALYKKIQEFCLTETDAKVFIEKVKTSSDKEYGLIFHYMMSGTWENDFLVARKTYVDYFNSL